MKCDNQAMKVAENQKSCQTIHNRASNVPTSTFITESDARIRVEFEYKYGNNDQEQSIQCSQILYQHQVHYVGILINKQNDN